MPTITLPLKGRCASGGSVGYKISDLDAEGSTKYYGYVDTDGGWYILRMTDTEARYVKGDTDYETNWTGRAGLGYDYYYNIF